MSEEERPAEPEEHESLRERIHDRIVAAELAAEEAAAYGPGTELVEAAEAAADPDRVYDEDEETAENRPEKTPGA